MDPPLEDEDVAPEPAAFEIVDARSPTSQAKDELFTIEVHQLDPPLSLVRLNVAIRRPGGALTLMNTRLLLDANGDGRVGAGDRVRVVEPAIDQIDEQAVGEEVAVELYVDLDEDRIDTLANLYWVVGR